MNGSDVWTLSLFVVEFCNVPLFDASDFTRVDLSLASVSPPVNETTVLKYIYYVSKKLADISIFLRETNKFTVNNVARHKLQDILLQINSP